MCRPSAVLASLPLIAVLVFGQAPPITADRQSEDEQSLIHRERQWSDAFQNASEVVLKELLLDDFIFTDDTGQVSDKHQYIQSTKNIRVKSYSFKDVTVRVYGETGIVAGRWTGVLTVQGKDVEARFRFTDTFVKRHGQWYAVASQDTKLA